MVLALLLWQALLNGWTVRGLVLDPSNQAVAGGRVRLLCRTSSTESRTDANGTFALLSSSGAPCSLRVSHPGFVDWTRELSELPADQLTVRLEVASVQERVEVLGPQDRMVAAATGAAMTPLGLAAFSAVGPDVGRWLTLAGRAAGEPLGASALRVNGLATTLPPATEIITDIRVAADAFGADASGGDRARIDISATPTRRWQFSASPDLIASERRGDLVADAYERSRNQAVSGGGVLNRSLDLRAFVSGSRLSFEARPAYLETGHDGDRLAADLTTSARTTTWTSGLAAQLGAVAVNAEIRDKRSAIDHAGLGGRTGPAGAIGLESVTRRGEVTWNHAGTTRNLRGGLAVERLRLDTAAESSGAGRVHAGRLLSGAPDTIGMNRRATTWQLRQILESPQNARYGWMVGVDATSAGLRETRTFNPFGTILLASPSDADGVRLLQSGAATESAAASQLALFAQRIVISSQRAWVRLGARADWQTSFGVAVAPLFAGAVRTGNFIVAGNLGAFSDAWSPSNEVERRFRIDAPAVASVGNQQWPITLEGLGHRRADYAGRLALVRPFRRAIITAEQTLTISRGLTGLSRRLDMGRLIDTLDHARRLTRAQTRLKLDVALGGWQTNAHYEFARSADDGPSPFALPALQSNLGAERGPSSGVARHTVTAVTFGQLRGRFRVLISARAASGTPYSLLSGLDPEGLVTFTGRVSDRRNQQQFSFTSDVSGYVARQFAIPKTSLTIDAGIRLENLLGAITVLDVERAASSAFAGRAVGTSSGRAISFWTTLGRH